MNTKKIIHVSLIKALLLTATMANASIELYFDSPVQSGGSVNVEVIISGLGKELAPSLSTYDLDIHFNDSHLAYSGIVFGDLILGNQLDLFGYGDNQTSVELSSSGVLNIFELSFDSPEDLNTLQADSFTLVRLTFNIVRNASSELSISLNELGDGDGAALQAQRQSVSITTVPLPSAVWLMLSGLGLLLRNVHKLSFRTTNALQLLRYGRTRGIDRVWLHNGESLRHPRVRLR